MGCGASAAVHETETLGSMEMHGVSPEEKDAELERLWVIYDQGEAYTSASLYHRIITLTPYLLTPPHLPSTIVRVTIVCCQIKMTRST